MKTKHGIQSITLLLMLLNSMISYSAVHLCPKPAESTLKWGEIPAPWQENPFSNGNLQPDNNLQFLRVNILVAGLGRGVLCTYRSSTQEYSIWWNTLTRIPDPTEPQWIKTLGGYMCSLAAESCSFLTAS